MQSNTNGSGSTQTPLFPDEVSHLEEMLQRLEENLQTAQESVTQMDREYMEAKNYMAQNRSEIDPHEMFQGEQMLRQIDSSGAFAVETVERLTKLMDSPYFARIDFIREEETQAVKYYIGRFSFSHEKKIIIFDWRAPVSSMFYDCELGDAGYNAPRGYIEGKLVKKRQFKIKGGEMEYALESSLNVQDDILQQELSHNSDEKMKSIISTIQKEQNEIIRNEKTNILIIQGVAGSGKTSIALHRIAFLLYRFKKRLKAQNVMILSPNKVFGNYISNVLPELGEEPIYEFSFPDIADTQLEGIINFQTEPNLEGCSEELAQRISFKSTLEFVKLMDEYIAKLPARVFEAQDYRFEPFTAIAGWIQTRFDSYVRYSVKKRLEMVADDIYDQFETDNIRENKLPGKRNILKNLKMMLLFKKTYQIYQDFYRSIGHPEMFKLADKKTLEWNDVFPFLYLHAAFEGVEQSFRIRHLVVDEMQDYTPIQYAVLNILFPCEKTILGDFGQFIHPYHRHKLEDISALYEKSDTVYLNKSYRSTYEIISLAKKIQPAGELEAIERHGDEPEIIACADETEKIRIIKDKIKKFQQSGYVTMGIVAKTHDEAERLYGSLEGDCEVSLISPGSTDFVNGISVTSVQMSKGLEFDEVIIPDAQAETYGSDYERGLLYVACTRAMHKLTMLHIGEETRFIK